VFWLYTCTIAFVGDTDWFLFGYKYKLKAVKANYLLENYAYACMICKN